MLGILKQLSHRPALEALGVLAGRHRWGRIDSSRGVRNKAERINGKRGHRRREGFGPKGIILERRCLSAQ